MIWVPSYIGLPGNNKADRDAKQAATNHKENKNANFPICDTKCEDQINGA